MHYYTLLCITMLIGVEEETVVGLNTEEKIQKNYLKFYTFLFKQAHLLM